MLLKVFLLAACATLCLATFSGSSKIVRPCKLHTPHTNKCVRDNFAANSRCRPPRGSLDQYRVARQRFETPFFNASYIEHDMVVTGQDRCFVSEFFFNVAEDTGVLGIDCPYLNFVSDRTLLQHRPLQQDDVYNYKINGTYPLVRLTSTFKHADKLNMCDAFTFAYVAALPTFHIDPKDRPTQNFLSKDLSLLNIFERETFFYRGNLLARRFINTRLCDFGCY